MSVRLLHKALCLSLVAALFLGCSRGKQYHFFPDDGQLRHYKDVALEIEYPDAHTEPSPEATDTFAPRTLSDPNKPEYWPLTLQEAVQTALANSRVMRDLGGRVVTATRTVTTIYDPAVVESDPRLGVEGALSAFDANLSSSMFWEKNDRVFNNPTPAGGRNMPFDPNLPTGFQQDKGTFQAQLAKRNATGGVASVRNNTIYDANTASQNLFPSAWDTNIEAEVRQPLLQGGGLQYNRIAGPNGLPGLPTGVTLARINTDISLTDFEQGVRTLVSDVENAYWDLYFAYRDLDAKIAARNQALETWRVVNAQFAAGAFRGEADREAQAREQYYLFQAQVEDALSGTPRKGTQSGAISGGGVFQGPGGVYGSERKLRFLLGLPVNDCRLIRPSDEPTTVKVCFDWDETLCEALMRRVELRRQKWFVKRRELELIAARNYLLPRLDAVGLYRWRGFGDDLFHANGDGGPFDNAVQNLTNGDYQEWQMGFQFNMPIGFRQAIAGVRNAQLQLTRERAVLSEAELRVSHDLGEAFSELDRAYTLIHTNFNRRVAAEQQNVLLQNKYNNPPADRPVPIEFLLDAQRRRADAETAYYRSLVEYTLAIKNVHFEKGSLLDFNDVYLAEGPWQDKAYFDAKKRAHERSAGFRLDYGFTRPQVFSRGPIWQQTLDQAQPPEVVAPPHAPAPPARDTLPPPVAP